MMAKFIRIGALFPYAAIQMESVRKEDAMEEYNDSYKRLVACSASIDDVHLVHVLDTEVSENILS